MNQSRFPLPTASDELVKCDQCDVVDNHEEMYWDDDKQIHLCEEHRPDEADAS